MADTPSVAEVLEQAAELLSKPGAWGQGRFAEVLSNGTWCYCADGAILEVIPPDFRDWACIYRALSMDGACELWGWNDEPERTQDEVVAKLREAAALARAESVA